MRSFVEKTLRVRSGLTRGIRRYWRSVRTVRETPTLPHAWPGRGWSRAEDEVGSHVDLVDPNAALFIVLTVFELIYLIGMH